MFEEGSKIFVKPAEREERPFVLTAWPILLKNYRNKREKRCCCGSHKQHKTLFKDHMVRFKIISLYIYKDLRLKTYDLRSNESRDPCLEDGNTKMAKMAVVNTIQKTYQMKLKIYLKNFLLFILIF